MEDATQTRQILATSPTRGVCLRGTYHVPATRSVDSREPLGERKPVGVVFLNSGFLPRSGSGDSAIYWADSLAKSGYPSFRFDLPGLGDSAGDLPIRYFDFVCLIDSGCYASVLDKTAQDLCRRFNLSGVVLVGPCTGATSAVYAASASRFVRGIVLLDPYFHLTQERTNARDRAHFDRLIGRIAISVRQASNRLSYRVLGRDLPKNTNVPLISRWHQLAAAKLPMLVLTASATKPQLGEFDYLHHIRLRVPHGSLVVKSVQDTDHSFLKGPGREAVRQHIAQWLNDYFPLKLSQRAKGNLVATGVVQPVQSS